MKPREVLVGSGLPRSILTALVVAVGFFVAQSASGRVTAALADECTPRPGEGWYCTWEAPIPPEYRRFFEAANNVRNWKWGKVVDAYGGTVAKKCLNALPSSGGAVAHVACGSGEPVGSVPTSANPSRVFFVQSTGGIRILGALAVSPYPI